MVGRSFLSRAAQPGAQRNARPTAIKFKFEVTVARKAVSLSSKGGEGEPPRTWTSSIKLNGSAAGPASRFMELSPCRVKTGCQYPKFAVASQAAGLLCFRLRLAAGNM